MFNAQKLRGVIRDLERLGFNFQIAASHKGDCRLTPIQLEDIGVFMKDWRREWLRLAERLGDRKYYMGENIILQPLKEVATNSARTV